ncbi:recombinase RecA, partial [Arthrospira platensis SPKY2]
SIALNAISYVQKKGGQALFIDAEQALDPKYAKILGVDTDRLGLTQLIIAEQVMYTIQEMIKSGTLDLIVVDSVASLVPQAEYDEPDKVTMALLARILSKH